MCIRDSIISASELSDDELEIEFNKIQDLLAATGFYFDWQDGVPARIVYEAILESLEEEDMGGEGWHNDGCSGYCPGCVQRPWCDTGQESCWTEDEKAGKMHLPEALNDFVSASPISLDLLREEQKIKDEKWEAFKKSQEDEGEKPFDDNFELPKMGDELFDISDN